MGETIVAVLTVLFAVILAILAFVLRKKAAAFPDLRAGYHHRAAGESREAWERVNRAAAALCAWFAGAGFVLAALFLLLRAGKEITLPLFFLYAAVSVFSVLFFPPRRAKT